MIPWLSVLHLVAWALVAVYELVHFRIDPLHLGERVTLVHMRCHSHSAVFSALWVVMAFFAGYYPAPFASKMKLFAAACLAIALHLMTLACAWEHGQPDKHNLSQLLEVLLAHCMLREDAPSRLSTELVIGGFCCLIGAPSVGLHLGNLACAKLEVLNMRAAKLSSAQKLLAWQLDATSQEVKTLHEQNLHLETARHEALVVARASQPGVDTARARPQRRARGSSARLKALDENSNIEYM